MKKLVIVVTVPVVLETWLRGQAKFLSQSYDVEIITSNAQNIKNIEHYEAVNIKTMDFNREINIFKDVKILLQLIYYFIKTQPDIVYTLTPKAGLLGMMASFFTQVPHRVHCVVGLPHLEAKGKRKFILEFTEKLTYLFANKLFCNSLNLKKNILLMTKKNVNIVGNGSVNGVDTNYFKDTLSKNEKDKIMSKLGLQENHFIIIFVGRIVNDKGVNELVKAFENLNLKYSFSKLLLVGDYKNETDIISTKSQQIIKNNNSIIYLEFQEDIREYLAISNLLVLPSYREGLPNVLIEAGSYGLPLVATNINGCNEVIIDEQNGLLINKKDEIDLFEAMERFIIDKDFYHRIKNNARDSIVSRYSQEFFYTELLKEFKKIES